MSDKLGIVAGSGRLPVQLAATCDSEARPHFVAALEGLAKPGEFQKFPHETIPLASYGRLIDAMRGQGCTDIVLAGGVGRPVLAGLAPDERGLKLLPRLVKAAGKAGGLLGELVKAIEENGFQVIAAQDVAAGLLVGPGPLGGHEADDPARKSIQLAVRAIHGRRDEGIQAALATPDHLLGIEDPDGTDAMISRWAESSSSLTPVLVKVSRPGQDRRVDLPTIGPRTIALASRAGVGGIALEAGASLILDREQTIGAADSAGLFILGIDPGEI